jgi:hypothetical protein
VASPEDLIAAGAATPEELLPGKRGSTRYDAEGDVIHLTRRKTRKGVRIEIRRLKKRACAILYPGVSEALPAAELVAKKWEEGTRAAQEARTRQEERSRVGHHHPVDDDGEAPTEDLQDWATQERTLLRATMRAAFNCTEDAVATHSGLLPQNPELRDLCLAHPRYRWCAGELERARQMLDETWARFDALVRSLRAEGRQAQKRLRLVVNNDDRQLH